MVFKISTLAVCALAFLGMAPANAQEVSDDSTPCFEVPGSRVTCGSHCWPNCDAHSGTGHPVSMDFNHYISVPEARSCYIDNIDYGRYDIYLSQYSQVNVTYDSYVF